MYVHAECDLLMILLLRILIDVGWCCHGWLCWYELMLSLMIMLIWYDVVVVDNVIEIRWDNVDVDNDVENVIVMMYVVYAHGGCSDLVGYSWWGK